jgi:hypothetical protein
MVTTTVVVTAPVELGGIGVKEVGVIGIGGINVVEGKTGTVELPVELEGINGKEVGVIGIVGNNEVEGNTGTVELTGGGPTYPLDMVAGDVEFAGALVVGITGTEVLLYEVGITGTKVVEVTFTVVGPVGVELRVDGVGAVPVPHVEGNELVLLTHGADR